jgi:gliding motility-associated-like protein
MINDGSLLHTNSEGTSTAGPVAAFLDSGNLEDGADHIVEIIWDPAGPEMKVRVDCDDRLVASVDLVDDIFVGQHWVTWGVVASTNGASNVPRACLMDNATGTDVEVHTCPEASVQLTAGGLNSTNYQWAPTNVVSDATLPSPTFTGVMSNSLSVTYTNHCGVEVTDAVEVIVDEVEVDLSSEGTTLNCLNETSLTCTAHSSFGTYVNYEWQVNNALAGTGMSFDMTSPGQLTLRAFYPETSSLLCEDEVTIQVSMDTTRFVANAGLPGTLTCSEPFIELLGTTNANDMAEVNWSTEDGTLTGPSNVAHATATSAGTYTFAVTNSVNGCVSQDQVTIQANVEYPEVTLGYVQGELSCTNPTVTLIGTEVFPQEYTPLASWVHAESGQVVSEELNPWLDQEGLYTLQVEFLENGCATTIKQAADVEASSATFDLNELVLPNIMTPDNNGSNDRFAPFVPGRESENVMTMFDEYHIQVYNRWGTLLFQNNGQPLQWDGRANGALVDPGSYIVSVSYHAVCGNRQGELQTTLEVIH